MYQHVSEYLRMTTSRFVPERSHRILFGAAAAALVLTVVLVLVAWSVGHGGHRLDTVHHEVDEDLLQLDPITEHRR